MRRRNCYSPAKVTAILFLIGLWQSYKTIQTSNCGLNKLCVIPVLATCDLAHPDPGLQSCLACTPDEPAQLTLSGHPANLRIAYPIGLHLTLLPVPKARDR